MQVNDNVRMKHFGNFIALLILAINALFTGLLLLVAYSPYIQPVTHPVQSCLGLAFPIFALINGAFLIFWLVIQRYKTALLPLIGFFIVLFATTDISSPQFSYRQSTRRKYKIPLLQHHGVQRRR